MEAVVIFNLFDYLISNTVFKNILLYQQYRYLQSTEAQKKFKKILEIQDIKTVYK